MSNCLFCGMSSSVSARFCSECGKNWSTDDPTIDTPAALQQYRIQLQELMLTSSDDEVEIDSRRVRERLKVSHPEHESLRRKIDEWRQAKAHLAHFSLEFDENVANAMAGHDTYLNFRFRNVSQTEKFKVELYWDDPETNDAQDFRCRSRALVKPSESIEVGGPHVFARAGLKEISELEVIVSNVAQESARFLADPFRFLVANSSQTVVNSVTTHNQISIEGRVVDASGLRTGDASVPHPSSPSARWRTLGFRLLPDREKPSTAPATTISGPVAGPVPGARYEVAQGSAEYGSGTILYTDGTRYEGTWAAGRREGKGTLTWPDGSTYQGEFRDDVRSGHGTELSPDGQKYVGEFRRDTFNGHGKLQFGREASGPSYEGGFEDGRYHGHGQLTFAAGGQFSGEFRSGQPWHGTYKWPRSFGAYSYNGSLKGGIFEGEGTLTYPDGSTYTGDFSGGRRNGYGSFKDAKGQTLNGAWRADKFMG